MTKAKGRTVASTADLIHPSSDLGLLASASLPAARAPQEGATDDLEEEVREPDDQVRGKLRPGFKGFSNDEEAVVDGHQQYG